MAAGRRAGGDITTGATSTQSTAKEARVRSILLFFVGVPIPVILLLALCTHHF